MRFFHRPGGRRREEDAVIGDSCYRASNFFFRSTSVPSSVCSTSRSIVVASKWVKPSRSSARKRPPTRSEARAGSAKMTRWPERRWNSRMSSASVAPPRRRRGACQARVREISSGVAVVTTTAAPPAAAEDATVRETTARSLTLSTVSVGGTRQKCVGDNALHLGNRDSAFSDKHVDGGGLEVDVERGADGADVHVAGADDEGAGGILGDGKVSLASGETDLAGGGGELFDDFAARVELDDRAVGKGDGAGRVNRRESKRKRGCDGSGTTPDE